VLIRQNAPVFGADGSPYQQPGDWQLTISSRNLVSNDHYSGTVEQHQRQELENYVNNVQNLLDIGVSRVFTKRLSVSLGVPFVRSSWAMRDPAYPLPAERQEIVQHGRGIGDISVTSRFWIFSPDTHRNWNVAAGGGMKFPTGNARYQDRFIGRVDRTEALRYVDQSVQPGDGGWGVMVEGHAFWHVKRLFLFGSGSYLVNPQDTNETPSIITVLGLPTNTGQFAGLDVNSVPDQYLARLGGSIPFWKGFNASLAWRMEGLKRYDVLGDSHGWRRPGTAMFVEPGVSYTNGTHTISFNVPVGYYFNRHPNPYTGIPGDATFPREIFLTSYALRLGKRFVPPATDQPPPPPAPRRPTGAPDAQPSSSAPASSTGSPFCTAPIVLK
jgi:hypothetical protein